MDRFYNHIDVSLPTSDLQLTSVTCLWIISKYLEVEPMDIKHCAKLTAYQIPKTSFVNRETEVIASVQCYLDVTTVLDFHSFFFKLLKLRMQNDNLVSNLVIRLLAEVEILSYDICRAMITDVDFVKEKPSLLSATSIFLALTLADKHASPILKIERREA
jgi:hypothetical protein